MAHDGILNTLFESQKKLVDLALKKHLCQFFAPGLLRTAAVYALFPGGKRIRPLLALIVADGVNASPQEALTFACALEILHNYTLIHDDLPAMDNDDFRRGKPTVHRKFGEACAILLGDAFLTHSFELLGLLNRPELIRLVAQSAGGQGIILGQTLDLNLDKRTKKNVSTLDHINELKTARLFEATIVGAALLAPQPLHIPAIRQFQKFAQFFGLCFQMADDLADASQESQKGVGTLSSLQSRQNLVQALDASGKRLEIQTALLPLKNSSRRSLTKLVQFLFNSSVAQSNCA
ncbi:MAG: polyprenyl synthetase family protein [Elusimicrobiota bacterium]